MPAPWPQPPPRRIHLPRRRSTRNIAEGRSPIARRNPELAHQLGAPRLADHPQHQGPPRDAARGDLERPHPPHAKRRREPIQLPLGEAPLPAEAVPGGLPGPAAVGARGGREEGSEPRLPREPARPARRLRRGQVRSSPQARAGRPAPDLVRVLAVAAAHGRVHAVDQGPVGPPEDRLPPGGAHRLVGPRGAGAVAEIGLTVDLGAEHEGIGEVARADLGEHVGAGRHRLRLQRLGRRRGRHLARHEPAQELLERDAVDRRQGAGRVERQVEPAAVGAILPRARGGPALVLHALHHEPGVALHQHRHGAVADAERRAGLARELDPAGWACQHLAVDRGPHAVRPPQRLRRGAGARLAPVGGGEQQRPPVVHHPPRDAVHAPHRARLGADAGRLVASPLGLEPRPRRHGELREQGAPGQDRGRRPAGPHGEPRARRHLDLAAAAEQDPRAPEGAERDLPPPFHEPDGDERLAAGRELEPVAPQELHRIGEVRRGRRRQRRRLPRGRPAWLAGELPAARRRDLLLDRRRGSHLAGRRPVRGRRVAPRADEGRARPGQQDRERADAAHVARPGPPPASLRKARCSRPVTGPGRPAPTSRPPIRTTGRISRIVEVMNTSSAASRSAAGAPPRRRAPPPRARGAAPRRG